MALPLPRVVADVGPGGPYVTAARGWNALRSDELQNQIRSIQAQYAPQMTQAELAYKQAQTPQLQAQTRGLDIANQFSPERLRQANEYSRLQNQMYMPNIQSEIASRQALTNKTNQMLPYEIEKAKLSNQFYPDLTKAQIQNYQMGGRGGFGTGSKDDMLYLKSVGDDNPGFNQNEIRQASNILAEGGTQMPDGRQINFSPVSQRAYDRALKSTTSTPLITQGVRSNQAEAELKVLNDYAQKGLEPYGTTYLNKSPQQIMDSFKSDEKSQLKLGRLIAAQALGYEAAQNRIRLANGQPGVTSTEELMKLSGQQISTNFPQLTYTARKEAARYMDEALKEGLKARQSVGIGASSILNKKGSQSEPKNENIQKWGRDATGKAIRIS